MFKNIARAISGDPQRKDLDKFGTLAASVNALEAEYEALSDDALRAKTAAFRQRLAAGETLEEILPEAFAAVREASKRTTGLRHFDVQMIGGAALHFGRIAEMRTGEGKTLVATLPLYLNALTGKGAHLVTVNDYLARRDARWMAPIYERLGMSVGVLQMSARGEDARSAYLVDLAVNHTREDLHQLRVVPRRDAYLADITYGTNNEFGFDYLRDNLVMSLDDRVQRGHHYAIVDEVDNILIDEARTPLIISGPASEDVGMYARLAQVVRALNPEDYEINEKDRAVSLTEIGIAHAEELLQTPLSDPNDPEKFNPEQERLMGYMEQALKAQHLFKKNKDYIVQNNQIVIVDEFTGRLMPGRRWSEGLHQAVEAKEGVKVNPENVTYATITLQNYFRKYEKLAGMTGTALTEAEEFATIYKLDVLSIPTNLEYIAAQQNTSLNAYQAKDEEGYTYTYYAEKEGDIPLFFKRTDYPDIVYRTEEAKLRAICSEIMRFHVLGRPQLVGTTSIEHSEKLSARLSAEALRRLAVTLIIRQAWMEKRNQAFIERIVPELEFLNQPLNTLKPQDLRQAAQNEGLAGSNPEDEINLQVLARALNISEANLPRLAQVMQGGIPHQVLNALKHDLEGQIIASAGAYGAVTIATNMAGRGVDIKLGGSLPEETLSVVRAIVRKAGREPYGLNHDQLRAVLDELPAAALEDDLEAVQAFRAYLDDMRRVRDAGGLHVIGSERHEARRIDNQLRGRAARQGDPGSSRFYLSLEDELMRLFGGERVEALMGMFKMDASVPLESRMLGRLVEQAQERVEGANFDIRKHLLEYDDVLNAQRERIYSQRDRVLEKTDLEEDVRDMLHSELERRIPQSLADPEGPWKLLAFLDEIQPSMFMEKPAVRVPSFTLLLAREELRARLQNGQKPLKTALLELAGAAVQAERDHLAESVRAFLQRTAETLEQQVAERLDTLDAFWDGLGDRDGVYAQPRALLEELNSLLRVRLNLTSDQLRALPGGASDVKDAIRDQVEAVVAQNILARTAATIEKRAGEGLNLPIEELSRASWPVVEDAFINALDELFDRRAAQYSAMDGLIAENIEAILKHQVESGQSEPNEIELLAGMAVGQRVAIDTRTRQRVMRRVSLFSYLFIAASRLQNEDAQTITERVFEHLEATRVQLRSLWGSLELNRASDMAALPMMAEPGLRAMLAQKSGDERFENLKRVPFGEWPEDERALAAEVFGAYIQNRIYRQILLSAISDRWVEHLTRMEGLRVSIRMEAYAQRDPLVQYKSVSSDAFSELLSEVRMGVISNIFRVQPVRQAPAQPSGGSVPQAAAAQQTEEKGQGGGGKKHKKRRRH